MATDTTAVADIEVVGSALGAYPGGEIVGILRPPTGDGDGPDDDAPLSHLRNAWVLVPRLLPCGECEPCRRGRVSVCPALSRRPARPQPIETVPARFVLPLTPPYLSAVPSADQVFRFAALSDGLLAPYSGLVRAGLGPGTLCVVLGRGFRAALSIVVARALGAAVAVVCSDATAAAAVLTQDPYGALAVIDDDGQDGARTRAALRQIAQDAGLPPHGLCLLETTGSDAGRARAISLLEAGGTAVLLDRAHPITPVGSTLAADLPLGPALGSMASLVRPIAEGCQILGGGAVHPDLLPELLALCERGRIDLAALTSAVDPNDVDEVMAQRRRGQGNPWVLPIVRYPVRSGVIPL